ncbi:MAG: HlyD family secretion protein [Candidatus Eremiobacteraeota bacterium]|nr:HlyD family secretion protein [Candidatus Eremiobacteraeota bacterium]
MAGREGTIQASTLEERSQVSGSPTVSADDSAPRTGRKRRIIVPIVVVVVLLGLFYGIRYWTFANHHVVTDDAQIAGNITTISSKVKGQVGGVFVHDDQLVHKGDRLVTLDERDLKVAVLQAEAAYQQAVSAEQAANTAVPQQSALTAAQTAQAAAGVSQSSNSVDTALSNLAAARSRVSQAQAQFAVARSGSVKAAQDLSRARALAAQGAVSQSQLDQARAAYESAIATRDAAAQGIAVAQAGVQQAQSGVGQAQAQTQASQAQLAQAQTGRQTTQIKSAQAAVSSAQVKAAAGALANAKLQLSYAVITAPIDGVVSKKSVNVGDTVAVGQPLMAIADQSHLWVTANLKETQIDKVRVGQPVNIHVDAYPTMKFTGPIESLSPATGATFALIPPDNSSGNFTKVVQRVPIRIAIDSNSDPQHLLRQGLSVEVTIDTSKQ